MHEIPMRSIRLDCNAALILLGNVKGSREERNTTPVVGMKIGRIANDDAEIFSTGCRSDKDIRGPPLC